MPENWLLIKRGLFYRPNNSGYTGIRDDAGRYSREDADKHMAAGGTAIRENDAPEFMPTAYSDIVIKRLIAQRDGLVKALEEIEALSDNCVNAERYGAEEALEDLQAIRSAIKRVHAVVKGAPDHG